MAARNALVRRLPAVETLGSVTVLATDKTGTLTEGTMAVRRLWTPTMQARVTGTGYGPAGEIAVDGADTDIDSSEELTELLTAAVLCNDARLRPPEGDGAEWSALGDPTEAALLAVAAKAGLDREAMEIDWPRIGEPPFDSDRKRMTTMHRRTDGNIRVACKGAPETLLATRMLPSVRRCMVV